MKTIAWKRNAILGDLRRDVWRYVTQAARQETDLEAEAAALLQMSTREVRVLAEVQFVLSAEVRRLLDDMQQLTRRLATTTVREEEWSVDRVRGPIQWTPTLSGRMTTGLPHLYVTAPARRAFRTPENEILAYALDTIVTVGTRTGWAGSTAAEAGREVRDRVAQAQRWRQIRMLAELEHRVPSESTIARVRAGRNRRRYESAIDVVVLHRTILRRLDRPALRRLIETGALAARDDEVLLELLCAFSIERALKRLGWSTTYPGLIRGGVLLQAQRLGSKVTVWYQHAPFDLSKHSVYRDVQKLHAFDGVGALRPDFVLRVADTDSVRWLIAEVKGVDRRVEQSARAATMDLLAYRRAFTAALELPKGPVYGIGIAWGAGLFPAANAEIILCSPDTIEQALVIALTPDQAQDVLVHETL